MPNYEYLMGEQGLKMFGIDTGLLRNRRRGPADPGLTPMKHH